MAKDMVYWLLIIVIFLFIIWEVPRCVIQEERVAVTPPVTTTSGLDRETATIDTGQGTPKDRDSADSGTGITREDEERPAAPVIRIRESVAVGKRTGAALESPRPAAAPHPLEAADDRQQDSRPAEIAADTPPGGQDRIIQDTEATGSLAALEEGLKAGSLILEGVNFRQDSSELTEESAFILDNVAKTLAYENRLRVEIAGYTSSSGDLEYNRALSQRRAETVRQYLIAKGIDPARLTAKGYGPDNPIADNGTPEGRERNRRVELHVIR